MKIKNLKITTQLTIVITILLTMAVLLTLVAFHKSREIEIYTNRLNNHPLKVRETVLHIESDLQNIRLAQNEYYHTKSIQEKNLTLQTIKSTIDSMDLRFYILYTSYLGPRTDIDEAYMAFSSWKTTLNNNLDLAFTEKTDSNRKTILFTDKESVYRGKMMNHLAIIHNFAKAKTSELFTRLYELNRSLFLQLRLMILAILVLTILATFVILRNIRRPIKEIIAVTRQFGNGNLEARAAYKSKNEFGKLSDVFNAMAEQIKIRSDENAKHTQELFIANKELLLQNEEKEKRASELIIANKELEAFSYSVSHDLRSPLRHISGFVTLLLDRYYDTLPDKARHYLDNIADSSKMMGVLIDDLLKFSRIGRQNILKTELDMNILVKDGITTILQDYKNRNIEWNLGTLPHAYGDPSLLQMVWTNLLSNAVKFTGTCEKAIINIKATEDYDTFIFSVADNGVGFDMQFANKLFGVFQRLHSSDEFEGTGIGLANVRRIIMKHGGRTWAEAEPDKGATFYFTLPKNKET
jgi:signal transduction histidine kinase